MSDHNPYEKLGVTEDASFEDIQEAKERLLKACSGDSKVLESIEAAYDAIIMERLRLRKEGRIKVPERIRFPEKLSEVLPKVPPTPIARSQQWLNRLLDTPSRQDLLSSAFTFLTLVALTLVYPNTDVSLLALLIAVASFANVYFLNRKERRFGRAVLLTLLGLTLGIGLGYGVANLLAVSNGLSFLTPEQIAAAITLILFWLSSSFLR
jgi:hypothetical protein